VISCACSIEPERRTSRWTGVGTVHWICLRARYGFSAWPRLSLKASASQARRAREISVEADPLAAILDRNGCRYASAAKLPQQIAGERMIGLLDAMGVEQHVDIEQNHPAASRSSASAALLFRSTPGTGAAPWKTGTS
jgi:hypothetical protein